jgi:hypothetical protein
MALYALVFLAISIYLSEKNDDNMGLLDPNWETC